MPRQPPLPASRVRPVLPDPPAAHASDIPTCAEASMTTRREILAGGLLTMIWGGAACSCLPAAAQVSRVGGCMLDDDEADRLLAKSTTPQAIHGSETIIASSGDRQFDYALAQTLSRLTDTFHVLPGFAYYDDT